jgi:lipopolysaccharide O-acetyltransferase
LENYEQMKYFLRGYTLSGAFYLLYCLLRTRLFFRKARLIRFPYRLRNLGAISGGINLTTGRDCRVDVFVEAKLFFGRDVQLNDSCHIACAEQIEIGDFALIASRVYISDHDHDTTNIEVHSSVISKPTIIGKRVWIGEGACILKGVTLGDDCIVGANAVVTRNFPAGSVIGGVPARLIRRSQSKE